MSRQVKDFEALFKRIPAVQNISGVKKLRDFIESYPDQQLWPNLYKLQEDFKHYRAINGDGNCFYRAMIFLYFREAELTHFEKLFLKGNLFSCKNLPFQNSKNIQSEALLLYIWQTYLLPLANLSRQQREKQLQKMINSSLVLDSALIAYFRVLNHGYLLKQRVEMEKFCDGGITKDLQRILTFGKQSQGVEIYTLAKILSSKITVLMVHRQIFQHVDYNEDGQLNRSYVLFYRPGHYDILSQKYVEQKVVSSKLSFTDYFKKSSNQSEITPQQFSKQKYVGNTNFQQNGKIDKSNGSSILSTSARNSERLRVSKPQQIQYISRLSKTQTNQIKIPINNQSFKKGLSRKLESQKVNIQRGDRQHRSPLQSSKRQVDQKENSNKVTKIKSAFIEREGAVKKQGILRQAAIIVIVLMALVGGVFAF